MTTKASILINGVPSTKVLDHREQIVPFLANFAARSNDRWTTGGLLASCLAAEKQVWKIGDWQALCLTSVGPDEVNIEACAGVRRHEWQDALDSELRAWARSLGKKRIFAKVRPGWAKYGKSRGYKELHREFMVEI